ncbi:MAG: hypothetical protein QF785_10925, partial [Phycisphaeraceae bacterium]|nr:hypothetical protein [Phycisphaeraceae bacterium]
PVIHVKRVYHRNNPIITVVGNFKIYPLDSYLSILFRSAEIWKGARSFCATLLPVFARGVRN